MGKTEAQLHSCLIECILHLTGAAASPIRELSPSGRQIAQGYLTHIARISNGLRAHLGEGDH